MDICNIDDPNFDDYWIELISSNTIQYRPSSKLCIDFQKEYFDNYKFQDKSYIVISNNIPMAGAIISSHLNENNFTILSGYGYPISYHENISFAENKLIKPRKIFVREFERFINNKSPLIIKNIDLLDNNRLNILSHYLLSKGADSNYSFTRIIDLSQTLQELHKAVRKSYRSLINWGIKNLNFKLLNSSNADSLIFENFKTLHMDVSGTSTRNEKTWNLQFERIKNNEAFLLLGYYNDDLATAAYFPYWRGQCGYGVSATKTKYKDKPMSHSIIWKAIEYSKQNECKKFEMGIQEYPNVGYNKPSKKELGISDFKRGFGGKTEARLITNLDANDGESGNGN